jgi:phosphohistidine phosphatase
MSTLYLLRHAKSSWDRADLADHDRPLAPRGRRATKRLAKHLRRAGISPSLVLCSSAERARKTLDGIAPGFEGEVPVQVDRTLYGASSDALLERLRALDDGLESVMLVGHNPAIQALALSLLGKGEELEPIERKYPTGGLATLTFAGNWRDLEPGAAELAEFVTPNDLA